MLCGRYKGECGHVYDSHNKVVSEHRVEGDDPISERCPLSSWALRPLKLLPYRLSRNVGNQIPSDVRWRHIPEERIPNPGDVLYPISFRVHFNIILPPTS